MYADISTLRSFPVFSRPSVALPYFSRTCSHLASMTLIHLLLNPQTHLFHPAYRFLLNLNIFNTIFQVLLAASLGNLKGALDNAYY